MNKFWSLGSYPTPPTYRTLRSHRSTALPGVGSALQFRAQLLWAQLWDPPCRGGPWVVMDEVMGSGHETGKQNTRWGLRFVYVCRLVYACLDVFKYTMTFRNKLSHIIYICVCVHIHFTCIRHVCITQITPVFVGHLYDQRQEIPVGWVLLTVCCIGNMEAPFLQVWSLSPLLSCLRIGWWFPT